MFIKISLSGIAGFIDLAVVPIKSALAKSATGIPPSDHGGLRRVALWEEAGGGVSVEKLLFSGQAEPAQTKAVEMIRAGRRLLLDGFPLEEIAAWCFNHNYRWRLHNGSALSNSFILEPGNAFTSDAKEVGVRI